MGEPPSAQRCAEIDIEDDLRREEDRQLKLKFNNKWGSNKWGSDKWGK